MFRKGNPHRYMVSLNGINRASGTGASSVPDIMECFTVIDIGGGVNPSGLYQHKSVDVMGTLMSSSSQYQNGGSKGSLVLVNNDCTSDTNSLFAYSGSNPSQIANDATYFYNFGTRTTGNGIYITKYNTSGLSIEKRYSAAGTSTAQGLVVTGGYAIGFFTNSNTTRYGFIKADTSTLATTSFRMSSTSHNIRGICTDGTSVFACSTSTGTGIVKLTISSMAIAAYKTLTIGGNAATCRGVVTDNSNVYVIGTITGSGFIAKLNLALDTVSVAYTGTTAHFSGCIVTYAAGYIFVVSTSAIRIFDTSLVYQKTITASGGLAFNIDTSDDQYSQIYADATDIYVPATSLTTGSSIIKIKHGLSGVYTSDHFSGQTLTWSTSDSYSSSSGTTANGTDIWTQTSDPFTTTTSSDLNVVSGLATRASYS